MGNITTDGVYLTIDQHAMIDKLRSKLSDRGHKNLADEYDEQMHKLYSKGTTGMSISLKQITLIKQIGIVLSQPLPKNQNCSNTVGTPARFCEVGEDLRIEPNGNKSFLPHKPDFSKRKYIINPGSRINGK